MKLFIFKQILVGLTLCSLLQASEVLDFQSSLEDRAYDNETLCKVGLTNALVMVNEKNETVQCIGVQLDD